MQRHIQVCVRVFFLLFESLFLFHLIFASQSSSTSLSWTLTPPFLSNVSFLIIPFPFVSLSISATLIDARKQWIDIWRRWKRLNVVISSLKRSSVNSAIPVSSTTRNRWKGPPTNATRLSLQKQTKRKKLKNVREAHTHSILSLLPVSILEFSQRRFACFYIW